jgi:hypothetical protein
MMTLGELAELLGAPTALQVFGAVGVVGQILWLLWRPQALWIRRPEQGATSGPKP